ncbi:nucleotidyltransferase domain-containing protein [Pararoseomonas sp. SCSIO 73927]|uniref:nucleotidyltransferase domain-containing protein n=1 Tax=Pararoseomonas sp. SCSIO 73927 TaxID=3114537 RepID=UPI0030CD5FFF
MRDAEGNQATLDADHRRSVNEALAIIERDEDVKVVFAVESGSRAWGFASPDSDWDVRFLYARPTRWFVQLEAGRDVIERALPNDLDLAGWDMRKAINLALKGNQALREWLSSPLVYTEDETMADLLRRLVRSIPSRPAAIHHYASLARQVHERWLRRDEFPRKKYLYAIRPALTLRWLRSHAGEIPPMDLPSLLREVSLSSSEREAIGQLLREKAVNPEMGQGPAVPPLHALIAHELEGVPAMVAAEPKQEVPPQVRQDAQQLLVRSAALADQRR